MCVFGYMCICVSVYTRPSGCQTLTLGVSLYCSSSYFWSQGFLLSYRGPSCPWCWCYRYVPGFYTGAGDQTWVSCAVWLSHLKLVLTLTDRALAPALCSCSHHLVGKHFSVVDVLKAILTTVTIQAYRLIALSLLLKILLVIFIVSNNVMICICL